MSPEDASNLSAEFANRVALIPVDTTVLYCLSHINLDRPTKEIEAINHMLLDLHRSPEGKVLLDTGFIEPFIPVSAMDRERIDAMRDKFAQQFDAWLNEP